MRLFIGIALPDEVRARLAQLCLTLKPSVPSAKWVTQPNFHVTLKFLGENPPDAVPDIAAAMRSACSGKSTFSIRLDRIGVFPSPKRARVIWLGLSDGAAQTTDLGAALEPSLERIGFGTEERPHHPHITLARLRVPRPLTQLVQEASTGTPPIDALVSVAHVTLFESKLSRAGAQYFVVEEVPLGSV